MLCNNCTQHIPHVPALVGGRTRVHSAGRHGWITPPSLFLNIALATVHTDEVHEWGNKPAYCIVCRCAFNVSAIDIANIEHSHSQGS